jgi:anti-sigma factor RsiW
MTEDREVAGIRCSQVLELLPDYLEGHLPGSERARAEAHLRGCTWCEEFGGRYATLVAAVRSSLHEPEAVPPGLRTRLRERLVREGILF